MEIVVVLILSIFIYDQKGQYTIVLIYSIIKKNARLLPAFQEHLRIKLYYLKGPLIDKIVIFTLKHTY